MCRLLKVSAVPLTMLTGKPYTGLRRIRFTPTAHLLNAFGSTLAGLVIKWNRDAQRRVVTDAAGRRLGHDCPWNA